MLNGKQSSSSFNDHAEAVEIPGAGRTERAQPRRWKSGQPKTPGVDGFTVASWCTHHADHLTGVNEATRTRYRRYIANDIAPSKIGPLPLAALTNADAAHWLNSLTGSAKTAANKHGFLAGALNAAVRARHISANPCDGNRLRRDEPAEMVFLTHDEFRHPAVPRQRLLAASGGILVASGARWGEATAPATQRRRPCPGNCPNPESLAAGDRCVSRAGATQDPAQHQNH